MRGLRWPVLPQPLPLPERAEVKEEKVEWPMVAAHRLTLDNVLHFHSCSSLLDGTSFHGNFQSLKSFAPSFCWSSLFPLKHKFILLASFMLCFVYFCSLLCHHCANPLCRPFLDLLSLIPRVLSIAFQVDGAYNILGGSTTMFPKGYSTRTVIWA